MAGLNVFIAPQSASHRDSCWWNQHGGSSALTNCTPRRLGNVAYVEKVNIRMRRWKKRVAEKIKIKMRRKRRVAAKTNTRMGRCREDLLKKSCSPSDRNLDPLLCSPTPHAVEAGRRILGKIRSQRPGRTCFFICSFCCWLFANCLEELVFLFALFAIGYLLFAWMNMFFICPFC